MLSLMSTLKGLGLTGGVPLPSLCRLCHAWARGPVCAACTRRLMAPCRRCPRCALPWPHTTPHTPPDTTLDACGRCEASPPDFDHALTAIDYAGPVPALFGALKFRGEAALSGWMAACVVGRVRQRWQRPDTGRWRAGAPTLIVPMPVSGLRQAQRGFNQARLVAQRVSRQLSLPMAADLLVRPRHTAALMGLDAQARQAAIAGAFAVHPSRAQGLSGHHVALIDDVLTTGATASEAAHTLWRAGAREVSVWVVARTPAPDAPPVPASTGARPRSATVHTR